MATRLRKTTFTAGELDPLLRERTDVEQYFSGAEKMRNVLALPQGGFRRRPGLEYIATPSVGTPASEGCRLASFEFSTEQQYLFAFRELAIEIYRNDALVATVVTPYLEADIFLLNYTQNLDSMVVFHPDYPTKFIQRQGSHTAWAISSFPFENAPVNVFAFNAPDTTGNGLTLSLATVGAGRTATADSAIFDVTHLGTVITDATGTARITGFTSSTVVTCEVLLAFGGTSLTGGVWSLIDKSNPFYDLTLSAKTVGANHTATAGNAFFTPDMVGWAFVDDVDGFARITSVTSPTVAVIEIIREFVALTRPEDKWTLFEPAWSEARGYPVCGAFFQNRLIVGGSRSLPSTLWASRSVLIQDFENAVAEDDDGIEASILTDDVPAIFNVFVGRHLQVFTSSGEFYVPISSDTPITPTNFAIRRTSTRGSEQGLKVFDVDGGTLFVQRERKALREFLFTDLEQAYQSTNVSLLSSHLVRGPVDIAVRRSTSTDEADYVLLPNGDDGTLAVFCTLRSQSVNAWTLVETEGSFLSCATLGTDMYFAIRRTINGASIVHIEKFNDDLHTDAATSGTGVAASATGLTWLDTEEVVVLLDFNAQPSVTVASNVATFARSSAANWEVGLAWPNVAPGGETAAHVFVRDMPVEIESDEGTVTGLRKRVKSVDLSVQDTRHAIVNGNDIKFRKMGSAVLDMAIQKFTGIKRVRGMLGWTKDGQVAITQNRHQSLTCRGYSKVVEI